MYNEEIKNGFIEKYSNNRNYKSSVLLLKSIFESCEEIEKRLNKDVAEIDSIDDLQNVLDNIAGIRSSTLDPVKAILGLYFKYYHNNPDIDLSILNNIKHVSYEVIRNSTVSSPLQLSNYLNKVFEPDGMVDTIYRCIYWLAYSGMKDDDIYTTTIDEVDLDNMIVVHDGQVYEIYKEAINTFRICKESSSFEYAHPRYSNNIIRDRVSGRLLVRGIKGTPKKSTSYSYISKRINAADIDRVVSISRARLSGVYYRTYEAECCGMPADFVAIIESGILDIKNRVRKERTIDPNRIRDLKNDYIFWKKAFGLE